MTLAWLRCATNSFTGRLWLTSSCLIGMTCASACAQENLKTLTLGEAMRAAIKQSPAISRAAHQSLAASERVREAQAGTLPYLAIQAAAP